MPTRIPSDSTPFYLLVWLLTWPLRYLSCRLTIEGIEHVPRDGGFVVASNHNMGPDYVLLNVSVEFRDEVTAPIMEQTIASMDRGIKAAYPEVKRVFVEAETPTDRSSGSP